MFQKAYIWRMQQQSQPKHVLLIAYQFCPKGQIGTRRWSKFAKYLSGRGIRVSVLCARYPYRDKVNWCRDVEHDPNIEIHHLAPRYLSYLQRPRRSWDVKLLDRLLSHTLYYLDKAQRWGGAWLPVARQLIEKENIRHVIVTGAPFTVMGQAARLKQRLPGIRLLLDFRDPWSFRLPEETAFQRFRKKEAQRTEQQALLHADVALFTTRRMKEAYAEAYPDHRARLGVLRNGYDEDDFRELPAAGPASFRMVHAGALFGGRSEALKVLLEGISRSEHPLVRDELQLHFFGNDFHPPGLTPDLQAIYDKKLVYHGPVPPRQLFEALRKFPFGLALNAPTHRNIILAKTFDYMGLGLRIFGISPEGSLSDILQQEGQYSVGFDPDAVCKALEQAAEDFVTGQSGHQAYEAYNYNRLTDELLKWLEG